MPVQAQMTVGAAPRISEPVDESKLTTLSGNTLRAAQGRFDRGAAPDNASGRMLLVLKRSQQQETELQQLLKDQQTRGSANYHKWLKPAEFGKRFGIADADVQSVTGYLASQGFQVGRVYQNKGTIEVTGTAAQIRQTFHTQMHIYEVGGKQFTANQSDPRIPQALAPVVAGFAALNNFHAIKAAKTTQAALDPSTGRLQPLYDQTANGTTTYGISPGDVAKIYNLPAAIGTKSVTIGVISDSNVNLDFLANYSSLFKTTAALPTVVVDGNDPGISDDSLTTLEELEIITGVDPTANLTLYTSATTDFDTGLNFAIIRAVDDDTANVLEIGASECEANLGSAGNQFLNNAWEQASAQGMSVIAATGDAGSAGCDLPGAASGTEVSVNGLAVNGYASTMYDTAIGGTDFYYGTSGKSKTIVAASWNPVNGGTPAFTSARGYIAEQPWNDSVQTYDQVVSTPTTLEGGGGGPSTVGLTIDNSDGSTSYSPYTQPGWQQVAGSVTNTARVIPDLSFFAGDGQNYSAYLLCAQPSDCAATSPTFTMAGGTAAAAAVFSGIAGRLVQQDGAQGNLNPEIYALYTAKSSVFHDVTNGANAVACSSGTGCAGTVLSGYGAATGYDAASGIGSVDATQFLTNWANINTETNTPSLVMSITANGAPLTASIPHGTLVDIAVTATGSAGSPTGNVAILSTNPYSSNKGVEVLPLNNGLADDSSNYNDFLPGGTYNLIANYAGSATYAPAKSNLVQVTVTPEASQILMLSSTLPGFSSGTFSGASIQFGTPVTITVEPFSLNVNSVGIPSGFIQVFDQQTNTQIAGLPINSEGSATFVLNQLGVGSHSLVFKYAGDSSYLPCTSILNSSGAPILSPVSGSTQTALSFVVGTDVASTTLTTSTTNVSLENPNAVLTAVVQASSLPNTGHAPSGTVTFSDGNSATLTPSYDSNGNVIAVASETVTPALILGGTVTYSAQYVPDANSIYAAGPASNTVSISESIIGLPQTNTVTTIAASTGGTTFANTSPLVFDITVVGKLLGIIGTIPNVSGTVTILANGVQVGNPVTLNKGKATFTVPILNNYLELPNGTVTITAEYNGDGEIKGCLLFCPQAADASYGVDQITITGNTGGGGSSNPNLSGDFSIGALNTAEPVGPSTPTATYGLQLTSLNNFAANYGSTTPINLTCTAPAGVTCSFDPSSVVSTLSISLASGFAQPNLYITAAPNYQFASLPGAHERPWWPSAGGATLACVLLFGIPGKRRKCQFFLMFCGLALLGAGLDGCSGSGLQGAAADAGKTSGFGAGGSGQLSTVNVGTYPVTVIATTTTTTNLLHSVTVNLVVNSQ